MRTAPSLVVLPGVVASATAQAPTPSTQPRIPGSVTPRVHADGQKDWTMLAAQSR